MTYDVVNALNLGATYSGLALMARLYDQNGLLVGSDITTGFLEIGASGLYSWAATMPTAFRGTAKIFDSAAGATLVSLAVNPEEVELIAASAQQLGARYSADTYPATFAINLGLANTGLTLKAVLRDGIGTQRGPVLTAGFREYPGTGIYAWAAQLPTDFRGTISILDTSNRLLTLIAVNPEEVQEIAAIYQQLNKPLECATYAVMFTFGLGAFYTGLKLSATLYDNAGNAVKGPIHTGFSERSSSGYYGWQAQIPVGFRGTVVVRNRANDVVMAAAALNPEDVEYRLAIQNGLGALLDTKTFTGTFGINAGQSNANLTLYGLLHDGHGKRVSGKIHTVFTELGNGSYGWTVSLPRDFRGSGTIYNDATDQVVVSFASNPEDLEAIAAIWEQVQAQSSLTEWASPQQPVIYEDTSKIDGCPVLTRVKAFAVQQGIPATLRHIFRQRVTGKVIDLSYILPATGDSLSDSEANCAVEHSAGRVKVRIKETLGTGFGSTNPMWELAGDIVDPVKGLVEVVLPPDVVEQAGIYEMGWGLCDDNGTVVLSELVLLSIERSLFAQDPLTVARDLGPPTLGEIRLSIRDSAPSENLLLRDVEFSTEEILDAIRRPIAYWNEAPPPVARHTTRSFPYRENWRKAVAGYLFQTAADKYRRNHLPYSAAGLSVDDMNKETQYLNTARMVLQEYRDWVQATKIGVNLRLMNGYVGSSYRRSWPDW